MLSIGGPGRPYQWELRAIVARRMAESFSAQQEEAWLNHAHTCRTYRVDTWDRVRSFGGRVLRDCLSVARRLVDSA
jgi:hypothetical protein